MSETKPTAGAMQAAEVICRRYDLGPNDSTRKLIAITIDRESGLRELVEASDHMIDSEDSRVHRAVAYSQLRAALARVREPQP